MSKEKKEAGYERLLEQCKDKIKSYGLNTKGQR